MMNWLQLGLLVMLIVIATGGQIVLIQNVAIVGVPFTVLMGLMLSVVQFICGYIGGGIIAEIRKNGHS